MGFERVLATTTTGTTTTMATTATKNEDDTLERAVVVPADVYDVYLG